MIVAALRFDFGARLRRLSCAACLALTPATFFGCMDFQCTTFDAGCGATGPILLNLLYNPELTLVAATDAAPAQSEAWLWRNREWTRVAEDVQPFWAAAYANERFLTTSLNQFWQSPDGRTWTASPFPGELVSFAFTNGRLVGGDGTGACPRFSDDLLNWSPSACPDMDNSFVIRSENQFWSSGGFIPAFSQDGATWTATAGTCNQGYGPVAAAPGGRFVAVFSSGNICISTDYGLNGVHYNDGFGLSAIVYHTRSARFIALDASVVGALRYSSSGESGSWSQPQQISTTALRSIQQVRGELLIGGDNATVLRSADGANWSENFGPAGATGKVRGLAGY